MNEKLSCGPNCAGRDARWSGSKAHQERVDRQKFERAVERDLAEVAMEHADSGANNITNRLRAERRWRRLYRKRDDRVEFYFQPTSEKQSGLWRWRREGSLAAYACAEDCGGRDRVSRTIVFDEIDSGIGGRVSESVGIKLKKLSESNQVLCVTHQPQIARFADSHLLVRKEAIAGRTEISIDRLDRRGRVEELARMLTGAEITETARRHARELLKT
jgi:DNA repair ATPase RecN